MTKELLSERINQLLLSIEQSAANHNVLLGRLNECKDQLNKILEQDSDGALQEKLNPELMSAKAIDLKQ
jgi:hypothetical protein